MSQTPVFPLPTPAPDHPAGHPAVPGEAPLITPEPQEDWERPDSIGAKMLAVLRSLWGVVTANGKVLAGFCVVAFFVLVAIFGPFLIHTNPLKPSLDIVLPPSPKYWLGTDQLGRDLFAQLVVGTRTSVFWSFLTGVIVMVIAILVGMISGYFGGMVDDVLSLITNIFLTIPAFPIAVVIVEFFSRSELTIALVVAFTNWPWTARVLRAQTLSLRSREFVTAARANGERTWRIIFQEIFPNELSIVAASFITTTIQVLLLIAGLEFLGLGDSLVVSWGNTLNSAQSLNALFQGAWWWFAPPGICIALLGAGLALMNFGIDELADPRLRQGDRRAKKAARAAKVVTA